MEDQDYLEIVKNLEKLPREQLINFVSDYWYNLKLSATEDMKEKTTSDQYTRGKFNMVEVNKIKLLLHYLSM